MKPKTATLAIFACILFTTSTQMYAQTYESMWKQVERAQQDDLPRQALNMSKQIMKKAKKEKNFGQEMKAWVSIVDTRMNLDPDSFDIASLPDVKPETAGEQAIYHCIMATAYGVAMRASTIRFDAETQKKYSETQAEHLRQMLKESEALSKENIEPYLPLMTKDDDSRLYHHDLLSVLTRFIGSYGSAVPTTERAELCQRAAQIYKEQGNEEAYTLMMLEHFRRNRFIVNMQSAIDIDPQADSLRTLLKESENLEAGADVAVELMQRELAFYNTDERLKFVRWAQQQFAGSKLKNEFINTEQQILRPTCHVMVGNQDKLMAGKPIGIAVTYKNMQAMEMEVRKHNGTDSRGELKTDGRLIERRTYTLGTAPENQERIANRLPFEGTETDSITLPAGKYVVICKSKTTGTESSNATDVAQLNLSTMRLIYYQLPDGNTRVVVLNNETGRQAQGAVVKYSTDNGKTYTNIDTDQRGEATLPQAQRMTVQAFMPGTDDETNQTNLARPYRSGTYSETETKTQLYTDRTIYRPGQIVHLSGIVYNQSGDETHTTNDANIDLTLYDINGEEVAKQTVQSNEWGVVEADFTLPVGRLPGNYHISDSKSSVFFSVEEYKRPTFTVDTRTEDKAYSFGDSLDVEAVVKTYSGVPVQGAKVRYAIQSMASMWRPYTSNTWSEVTEGETTTDASGVAHVAFELNDDQVPPKGIMRYRVTYDVTSQAGETHSATFSTSVSHLGFGLTIDTDHDTYDMAHPADVVIKATNAQNKPLDVKGHYAIKKTKEINQRWYDEEEDEDKEDENRPTVATGNYESGKPFHLPQLDAGYYKICAYATDNRGNSIKSSSTVIVLNTDKAASIHDKRHGERNEYSKPLCYIQPGEATFSETKPAEIYFATASDDIYLTYIVFSDSTVVDRQSVVVDRELRKLSIGYKPEYGKGVTVIFYYVRNGESFITSENIVRVEPEKELELTWKTFRDRLYPGQEEQWVLTVKDKQGKTVSGASLMATIYDSSLDALRSHGWHLGLYFDRTLQHFACHEIRGNSAASLSLNPTIKRLTLTPRSWDELTEYVKGSYGPVMLLRGISRAQVEMSMDEFDGLAMPSANEALQGRIGGLDIVYNKAMASAAPALRLRGAEPTALVDEEEAVENETGEDVGKGTAQPRRNFAETAFFASHIVTDADGDAHISFTLPESLTEWKFMGLVHTKEMDYGTISAQATARKDFMVQPNMPRFIREGDKVNISSSVINRTSSQLDATIVMRIFDAESMEEIYVETKTVGVESEQTVAVDFSFDADGHHTMLVCEINGVSNHFSDGERQYLPVLTSKRYVTETIPFYVLADEQHKDIDIHTLFNNNSSTASHRRMLLEFTQNPAWTIVEALEAVKVPERNDAVTLAAALYSNTTAARLAHSIPGLQDALLHTHQATSELDEADDELRDIIQQESPWMRDARKEARQRTELADFFNQSLITHRIDESRTRLLDLQKEDGSWSWFEGMDGSYYITLSVCEMLAMMDDPTTHEALIRGMHFLDQKELERYNEAKRRKLAIKLGESTLHYLYVWSLTPERKVKSDVTAMREAYLKELGKSSRTLSIYGKANGAIILRAFNHTKQANTLLQSAVEYTIEKSGMGRYYATDRALYSWRDYRIPTHLAAMRAISQSDRTDRDLLLTDMQLWLMRQKQVQMWDNPMNTIAAVDFLKSQMQDTGSQYRPAFTIDGNIIETPTDTTRFLSEQLGYIKTEVPLAAQPSGTTLSVDKSDNTSVSNNVAFGAVYGQYLDQIDAIQESGLGEMSISRKYYKGGKEFDPASTTLAVGDKVTIRLVISADRDMDFVQVRTGHAACLEPSLQLSGYRWMNGRGGYVSMHDASVDIFFDRFTRGTTTYDIDYHVTRTGTYLSDIATMQCAYAPEFSAHTAAAVLNVK